ncbi:bacteriohemerythrin [Anaerotignum sp. MB30-C6]|uniref:bacteriohemerythrin n=1 Tax=Anaerotignum sp. MB30-C6 TaxID=3070814 RepID=UPI0027DC5A6E|nr:bacteriohemerythrin [Anaerotignum sp. MB30-C6]WMI81315.1 bacteriohemerythrin [Anaerotignum sp. MB30-C6]
MAFSWTKDLETGNAQIDTEHKELIQAINNLLEACSSGKGRNEIANTVDFLNQYTKTHFAHEQILQQKYKYPDFENHKKYHEGFIKVVEDFTTRLKANGPTIQLVGEINMQLGSWLINHIKREDVKVAKHILQQGK